MVKRLKNIDESQKLELLQRMEAGENVSKLASEVGVSRQRLYEWRDQFRIHGSLKSRRRGRPPRSTAGTDEVSAQPQADTNMKQPQEKALTKAKRRIKELEQKVGQQQLDLDFFREALRHFEEDRRLSNAPGETRSSGSLKK